jgi:cytoskeleton protein RodZ
MSSSENFGSNLKRERELRAISLQEVAAATHIRLEYLEALEQGRFEKLPGLTFLKGYIRAYVQFVGLDFDEVMLQIEPLIEQLNLSEQKPARPRWFFIISLLVLLVLFVLVWSWLR